MGDYFFEQPGGPTAPPEPDTPPPNFTQMGAGLAAGFEKAGGFQGLLNGLVDILVRAFAAIVGWFIVRLGNIASFIISTFAAADEEASGAYGPLVSSSLEALLGVKVSPAEAAGMLNAKNRAQLAEQVGGTIFNSIFSGVQQDPSKGIQPSDTGPKAYLGQMAHMAIEGWMQSWILDMLSVHELEKFGELKDTLAHVLGLGRMSRAMFRAPMRVLIEEPYTMLLNEKYRPKQLAEATAIRQFFRGQYDRDKLSEILGRQGYSEQYIEFLIQEHNKYLPMEDVDYLVSRGMWTTEQASKYLQEQGWETNSADHLLAIMADKRIHKYRLQMVEAAQAAFAKKDIGIDQFQTIVHTSGLTDEEQTWLIKVAGIRQELHATHLSRGDIERGIEDGILNLGDLRKWALRENMPLDEEQFLELMVLYRTNKQTAAEHQKAAAAAAKATAAKARLDAAAAKAAQIKSQAADKGVSVAQAETLVKEGAWTFDHLTAFLTSKGYGGDAIDAITTLLHNQMGKTAVTSSQAGAVRAVAKSKGLSLAEMEKAVVEGIITLDDLQRYLLSNGFDQADTDIILHLTQDAIDRAKVKATTRTAAHAGAAGKEISLAELERAARLGLTTVENYAAALQAAGYDAASVALLVGMLNQQMAADKATASKRAGALQAGTSVGITLQQLEAEVIHGIRPIADYTAELATMGYSADDQQQLTALLQAKIDQAKATAAKRAQASAQLADRGISLAQAERAVRLNVVPITTYTAMLQAAGYSAQATDTLAKSLLAEVAKTAKAQTAATTAGARLASKGVSLPDLERAVIAGIRSISEYTDTLIQNGYTAAAADTLTELLQLKVDQAAYAQQRHADAEGAAAQRGLNLAQEEAAVIAGDASMENFDAFLTALGYDPIDRGILKSLLSAKVAAAANKAAAASAKAGGASQQPAA